MDWLPRRDGPTGALAPQAALLARFDDAGYARIETSILEPASVFLDFSGEEIRSALFLTADGAGTELCLRPEYTIPVCRAYLASPEAGRTASYSCFGPVFRSVPGRRLDAASGQSLQAGLESFGRPEIAAADAEVLALSLKAAEDLGLRRGTVRMGDAGLLGRVLDALDVSPAWQRRIKRGLDKGVALDAILTEGPARSVDHSGVLAALDGTDHKGARALVEDLLSIAGIATVGGRSAAEIAERFMGQVANRAAGGFPGERRQVLERFLALQGHPDAVAPRLRAFAADAKLDLSRALDLFEDRANFIALHDEGTHDLVFEAAFGRNLGYYTGFVFEIRAANPGGGRAEVLAGGGRYDGLAQALGSGVPIAAVGVAIWVDRLLALAEARS